MVQFGHLGFNGCSLVDELVLPLFGPMLGVHLSSASLPSLLLLIGLLQLREEIGAWVRCDGLQLDHWDSQKC
jgi:hypothetical protein